MSLHHCTELLSGAHTTIATDIEYPSKLRHKESKDFWAKQAKVLNGLGCEVIQFMKAYAAWKSTKKQEDLDTARKMSEKLAPKFGHMLSEVAAFKFFTSIIQQEGLVNFTQHWAKSSKLSVEKEVAMDVATKFEVDMQVNMQDGIATVEVELVIWAGAFKMYIEMAEGGFPWMIGVTNWGPNLHYLKSLLEKK
jgi:hypothetical protein